jgi:hypothetical protein
MAQSNSGTGHYGVSSTVGSVILLDKIYKKLTRRSYYQADESVYSFIISTNTKEKVLIMK